MLTAPELAGGRSEASRWKSCPLDLRAALSTISDSVGVRALAAVPSLVVVALALPWSLASEAEAGWLSVDKAVKLVSAIVCVGLSVRELKRRRKKAHV